MINLDSLDGSCKTLDNLRGKLKTLQISTHLI